MINLATWGRDVTHDSLGGIKSKKFTERGHSNKLCLKKTYSCLGWWESTKWISWKEFAQTGRENVCDKVKINKLQ
jgi:hypothetical protein